MSGDRFYITCAIDYVNAIPHLGHAYEKVAADALARYHRLAGREVTFLVGTDEHSLNVEKAAQAAGQTPREFTDAIVPRFEAAWRSLRVSYDVFIRTSEDRHARAVRALFQRIHDRGDIFPGKYTGYYCVSCEGFKQEKDLEDGNCPVHGTPADWIEEENYFFRLSSYQEPLLKHFREHPEFLVPAARRNEIVNVIESGLEDISISRPGSGWGVPLPFDDSHRVYVWFDALINYITAVGYGDPEGGEAFRRWWPADLHVIGKDITRFHAVLWPAMLLSAGVELPRQILGHGFITFGGEKLSKSAGNVVDPLEAVEEYGCDPIRYYLLKEVPLDRDGDFTWELFIERYNSELANDLGNLVSRTATMAVKYFDGDLPAACDLEAGGPDAELRATVEEAVPAYRTAFESLAVDQAVAAAWTLVRRANQYIEETAPWKLAKDDARRDRLGTVLNALVESVRIAAVLLTPVLPGKSDAIRETLRMSGPAALDDARWDPGAFRPAEPLAKPAPLFPRIDAGASIPEPPI